VIGQVFSMGEVCQVKTGKFSKFAYWYQFSLASKVCLV